MGDGRDGMGWWGLGGGRYEGFFKGMRRNVKDDGSRQRFVLRAGGTT